MMDILNRFDVIREAYEGPMAIIDVKVLESWHVFEKYPDMKKIMDTYLAN